MDDFRKLPFEQRRNECQKVVEANPGRIPVICDRMNNSTLPSMQKIKFLVPSDATIHNVIYIIRRKINIRADQGVFIFINGTLPSTSRTLGSIYQELKSEDGFLYISYTGESTFG